MENAFEVFKPPQEEKLQERRKLSRSIGATATRLYEYGYTDEQLRNDEGVYFEAGELDIRRSNDLVIGLESMRLKNLLKEKSHLLSIDEIRRLNKVFDVVEDHRSKAIDIAVDEIEVDGQGEIYPIDEISQTWETLMSRSESQVTTSYNSKKGELRKLKRKLTAQAVHFNRQIQIFIDIAGDELNEDEVENQLRELMSVSHQLTSEKDGKAPSGVYYQDRDFCNEQIREAIVGARNENWFRDFIKTLDFSQAVNFYRSSVDDDVRGIDAYLQVKFVREDGKIALAESEDIKNGNYEKFELPIDIASSSSGMHKKFEKIKNDQHQIRKSWPMVAYFHQDDIYDKDGRLVNMQLTPEHLAELEMRYSHYTANNWEETRKPIPLCIREMFIKRNIIMGLEYYLDQHPKSSVTKKLIKRSRP